MEDTSGNEKAKLNFFGLYVDDKPNNSVVNITRDRRVASKTSGITFKDAETLEFREKPQVQNNGIELKFEGTTTFKRNKADDVYHYDNLSANVMKSLGVVTPVRTKVDINTDYTPNSTIVNI